MSKTEILKLLSSLTVKHSVGTDFYYTSEITPEALLALPKDHPVVLFSHVSISDLLRALQEGSEELDNYDTDGAAPEQQPAESGS